MAYGAVPLFVNSGTMSLFLYSGMNTAILRMKAARTQYFFTQTTLVFTLVCAIRSLYCCVQYYTYRAIWKWCTQNYYSIIYYHCIIIIIIIIIIVIIIIIIIIIVVIIIIIIIVIIIII